MFNRTEKGFFSISSVSPIFGPTTSNVDAYGSEQEVPNNGSVRWSVGLGLGYRTQTSRYVGV